MRHLIALAVLLGGLAFPATYPALAAETGTIVGRVLHADTDEPLAGVEVTLSTGTESGEIESTTVASDARGRFRFEALATGEDRFYAVDAAYQGGLFAGRPLVIPSDTAEEPVIRSTLRVWDTTTDPASILMRRDDVFVVQDGSDVGVIEAITFVNPTGLAYIGRGGDDDEAGAAPSLGFWLPESADPSSVRIIEGDLDVPELVPTEYGFAATVAVPPGETSLTFAYTVEGTGGTYDLSRTALYSISEVGFYAEPPLRIESNRLAERGDVEIGDRAYTHHSSDEGLDPADPIQVLVTAEAAIPVGVFVGSGAALALVAVAVFLAWRRLRSRPVTLPPSRAEVLTSIARLDLRHEAGEIDEAEWRAQRSALKDGLREGEELERTR